MAIESEEIPNDVTIAAMKEAEDMISGKNPCDWYRSPEDLIDALKKLQGSLGKNAFGFLDGVAYQRKIRDEWDD